VAAVQEERFSRIKHDLSFPKNAIQYCLSEAGCKLNDIDHFIFYEKPLLKFKRLSKTYLNNAPKGLETFLQSMQVWIGKKFHLKHLNEIKLACVQLCNYKKFKLYI
jgi:carbamoyltransferase